MQIGDTIVAIASPPGHAPRGIVRISGPRAFEVTAQLLEPESAPTGISQHRRHSMMRLRMGLPCILFSFPAPATYTGEDVVEFVVAGQPLILNALVNEAIQAGVRQATAGEFTARAFFNGRISLTDAEAISTSIAAESDAQLRAAHLLTSDGALSTTVQSACHELTRVLALVEAGIDFSDEEDVQPISPSQLRATLEMSIDSIESLLQRAVGMERVSTMPRVVICGAANAGKSTLFNALLGRPRAVVSAIAGTTRDVLVEPLHLDADDAFSPEIALVDLAGFDDLDRKLNLYMQSAARDAILAADLVLFLRSAEETTPVTQSTSDHWSSTIPDDVPTIQIRSKTDLLPVATKSQPKETLTGGFDLSISAVTGLGLAELKDLIRQRLARQAFGLTSETIALAPRHEHALRNAMDQLQQARNRAHDESEHASLEHVELIAATMRSALDELGSIIGRITPDDVLDHVFSSFCIGK